jgi:hypothetical protein
LVLLISFIATTVGPINPVVGVVNITICSTMAEDAPSFLPGDVVKTVYGVGVITSCPPSSSAVASSDPSSGHPERAPSYRVLLWRIPGKSIASSSVAYLQANAVSEK